MTVPTNNNSIINELRRPAGQPDEPYHAFIAGALGGYVIWGRYSSLNYQLVLYLASRVAVACIQLAREKGPWKSINDTLSSNTYPCMAAGIWGAVMMLFESYPDTLHSSLRRSMDEIYRYTGVFG
jgi:peroxisomal membrane protein 4